jgi:hypothetical protein
MTPMTQDINIEDFATKKLITKQNYVIALTIFFMVKSGILMC